MSEQRHPVTVTENGEGPYGQTVSIGTHTLAADEPETLGGHGSGPDPYELLLAALGACTNMTLRMYARQKDMPLGRMSVSLTHHKETNADGQKVDVFERVLSLSGDLTPEQRARLLEIADRCPVGRTLEKGSRLITTLVE